MRSPAVATTYDIGEDDGTLFIVMELVEGETLSDRLQRGPLSVRQTLGMTLQIADALDEATASASFTEMSRPQIW